MIKENIDRVKQRICGACSRSNQNPHSIAIVCASKGRDPFQIQEVVEAGITGIGENRVQEAVIKYRELANQGTIKWHLVGHLQTNKVREAVKIFDLIQSVDSLRIAGEIDRQAAKINKIQDILIEVKTSPEENKFGIMPDEAVGFVKEVFRFNNINIKGLMTIAPVVNVPEQARDYFRMLKGVEDRINCELRTTNRELDILSMGMSDDFEVAIEEGSNMVRIGRAIFEG